jgi:hypothetical protein
MTETCLCALRKGQIIPASPDSRLSSTVDVFWSQHYRKRKKFFQRQHAPKATTSRWQRLKYTSTTMRKATSLIHPILVVQLRGLQTLRVQLEFLNERKWLSTRALQRQRNRGFRQGREQHVSNRYAKVSVAVLRLARSPYAAKTESGQTGSP